MKIQGIEIKDGYLLVVKTSGEVHNMTVVSNDEDDLGCVTPSKHWWPLDCFTEDGEYDDSTILAIYGRTHTRGLLNNSTEGRKRLWERKEVKKMTVAQICAALGYDVEIVKEAQE